MNYKPIKNEEFFITYQVTFRTNDRVENFSKHRDHVTKELSLQFGSSLVEVSPARIVGHVTHKYATPAEDKKTSMLGRIGGAFNNFFGLEGEDE